MSHVTARDRGLTCFAAAGPGLEPLVAAELRALGELHSVAVGETEPGGVSFRADRAGLYAANLHLRIASRVLVRMGTFHASAFHELERHAARLPWREFVASGSPVAFRVTSRKSRLYHQDAIAQRLLAVAGGTTAPEGDAAQEFVVRLFRDECTVSADASGELLHRRGYRLATAKAPLRETLAAAMLMGSGWDGSAPLVDPMCGSGTIPIEAALAARRIPPGLLRGFAVERWPGVTAALASAVRAELGTAMLAAAPGRILGSDRDAGAIESARGNAARADVSSDVELDVHALSAMQLPEAERGWIVSNPPYGVRVGDSARVRDLWAQLGNVLRRRAPGWQVTLLSPDAALERQLQIPLRVVARTTNGGIPVRIVSGEVPGRGAGS